MSNFVRAGRPRQRWWPWVLSIAMGAGLLAHPSSLPSGLVATLQAAELRAVGLPALSCRIPVQELAPRIRALSKDIARRFHLAESAAVGITHAAFTAGRVRGVDPMLVLAVAAVESKFKTHAVNPLTGAKGLMQVVPQWHQDKIVNVGGDPSLLLIEPNIAVGTAILADYLDAEDGDLDGALARYLGTAGGVRYSQRVHLEMRHLTKVVAAT